MASLNTETVDEADWGYILYSLANRCNIKYKEFLELPMFVICMYWEEALYHIQLDDYKWQINIWLAQNQPKL